MHKNFSTLKMCDSWNFCETNPYRPCNPCMTAVLKSSVSSPTFDYVGETIMYSFTLTNTSGLPLTNIDIVGNRLGPIGTVSLLLPGQGETITIPYTVTQADIDNVAIVNLAVATGDGLVVPSAQIAVFAPIVITTGSSSVPVPMGAISCDVILIAGGGGGGSRDTVGLQGGGGGGAGEVKLSLNNSLAGISALTYSVGAGGQGGPETSSGDDGGNTSITIGSNTITTLGGQGARLGMLAHGGDGGNSKNNGAGGGGAPIPGFGGSPNGQNGNNINGGNGGTGSASNFNPIFSNARGLGGLGGLCKTIFPFLYGAGGGGGGGVGAIDPNVKGGDPTPSDPSNGHGGTGYGAGGGGAGPGFSFVTHAGNGAGGVIVIQFR